MEDNSEIIKCPHCAATGTCLNENGVSCGTCLKEANIKNGSQIVACCICGGCGISESKTDRLKKRAPFLVMSIVLAVFYIYATISVFKQDNFDKVFPVVGSLTTMIATFYFSQKK